MTVPLSPAAQAVLDAYKVGGLDAALRAAADQVAPKSEHPSGDWTDKDEIRCQLLAIASELYPA